MQFLARQLADTRVQLALFVGLALLLRCATFGALDRHADETFYFLVGQRMHEGALPYVDVWDRKPLGLFLIYYLLAGISRSVICYQIAACVVAGIAATIVCRIVSRWSNQQGAVAAGLTYLLALGQFEGGTGQSPDFYNPFIAGAVLMVLQDAARHAVGQVGWRTWCAMGLCGLALTVKQTTIFESVFLGCFMLNRLHRSGVRWPALGRVALGCCVLGAAPTVLIGLFYLEVGHWPEFWHAMVTSNFAKTREGGAWWRALSIVVTAGPLPLIALAGFVLGMADRQVRTFVAMWTGAALLGFAAIPNLYGHYFLPVLVPLSVATGFVFGHLSYWRVIFLANLIYSLLWYDVFDSEWTIETNRGMREMASLIRRHDPGGGLLVFDGPVYLYAVAGERFLSPLVFPQHLNHQIENNVSHLDTHAEIDRILAARPGVIVMSRLPRSHPVNSYSRAGVLAYARSHCHFIKIEVIESGVLNDHFVVFGDCR